MARHEPPAHPPPLRPGRDEDLQRDQRRAKAADVHVADVEWQAAAETGVDLVYERAQEQRQARVTTARAARDLHLQAAQEAEAHRRQKALSDARVRKALEQRTGA